VNDATSVEEVRRSAEEHRGSHFSLKDFGEDVQAGLAKARKNDTRIF
jgi:hypothetical protein